MDLFRRQASGVFPGMRASRTNIPSTDCRFRPDNGRPGAGRKPGLAHRRDAAKEKAIRSVFGPDGDVSVINHKNFGTISKFLLTMSAGCAILKWKSTIAARRRSP